MSDSWASIIQAIQSNYHSNVLKCFQFGNSCVVKEALVKPPNGNHRVFIGSSAEWQEKGDILGFSYLCSWIKAPQLFVSVCKCRNLLTVHAELRNRILDGIQHILHARRLSRNINGDCFNSIFAKKIDKVILQVHIRMG